MGQGLGSQKPPSTRDRCPCTHIWRNKTCYFGYKTCYTEKKLPEFRPDPTLLQQLSEKRPNSVSRRQTYAADFRVVGHVFLDEVEGRPRLLHCLNLNPSASVVFVTFCSNPVWPATSILFRTRGVISNGRLLPRRGSLSFRRDQFRPGNARFEPFVQSATATRVRHYPLVDCVGGQMQRHNPRAECPGKTL